MHSATAVLQLVTTCVIIIVAVGRYTPDWESLDSRQIPQWYTDAKLGIFLHWSIFSVTEVGVPNFEWHLSEGQWQEKDFMRDTYAPGTTYTDLCRLFTAKYYNATKWVELFEAAGAKYVVLTSKHLEGFCNWNTSYSERWNSVQCGPGRDLLGELESAVRKSGKMRFGIYHGLMDVLDSLFIKDKQNNLKTNEFVVRRTTPQLHELIENYKPDLLWSDADYQATDAYFNSTNFLAWLYNDSPVKETIVVNDRWGQGIPCHHGGFYTCEDGFNPLKLQKHYFESCTTSGSTWGYNKHDNLEDIMSPTQVITKLIQVVSCNGNLLLNIAPTYDGFIMPIFQNILHELGNFLSVNGKAIYGSSPWKAQNDTVSGNVWYTQRKTENGTAVYACITDKWPGKILALGAPVPTSNTEVIMLGLPLPLQWKYEGKIMNIQMPIIYPDSLLKHAWILEITGLSD